MYKRMADAAFAQNIPPGFDAVGGYFPGRDDYHAWTEADWDLFPGAKLPITVPAIPGNGKADGANAVAYLKKLGVPQGCVLVVDMETKTDAGYLLDFGSVAQQYYKVWVYGSLSSIFGNPPLNGYWVADYTTMAEIDRVLQIGHVRAAQYAADLIPGYDVSLIKEWAEDELWTGN